MAVYVLFALLALCTGQTVSPTPSPSCSASPGYFCSGGSALICPIGAYCAGGSALNVSCYPVSACSVIGLITPPPCYWGVSTIAGSGSNSFVDGAGSAASFKLPQYVAVDDNLTAYIADSNDNRVRKISKYGVVTTLLGSGLGGSVNGIGTSAQLNYPWGVSVDSNQSLLYVIEQSGKRLRAVNFATQQSVTLAGTGSGGNTDGPGLSSLFSAPMGTAFYNFTVYIADYSNDRIRSYSLTTGFVSTFAGSTRAWADGQGTNARFNQPRGLSFSQNGTAYVADTYNYRVRAISSTRYVTTIAGTGFGSFSDGVGTAASFNLPFSTAVNSAGFVYVADQQNNAIRVINPLTLYVSTIGTRSATWVDGILAVASFYWPTGLAIDVLDRIFVADSNNRRIRVIACLPCPASYYCFSGAPIICPAGSFCPLSSINATLCPEGSFSNSGASNCTLCQAGFFSSSAGSTSCQQCPGGHYCPFSRARLNCGRGNYCPDGSGAPTPCPYQVPPTGGWGALQVQGPAFLVETSHCLNHCFWNFTSGDGMLSKC
jgi:hypothetical protein